MNVSYGHYYAVFLLKKLVYIEHADSTHYLSNEVYSIYKLYEVWCDACQEIWLSDKKKDFVLSVMTPSTSVREEQVLYEIISISCF